MRFFHSSVIAHFAPGWFALVMGTGAITISLASWSELIPLASSLGRLFLWLTIAAFLVSLIPWTLRWFFFYERVRADLNHPVAVSFFPTMPIALLLLGIAIEKFSLFPEVLQWSVEEAIFLIGALGILLFALIILNILFHKPEIEWQASTMGWLIPPVSALIVPLLGAPLVQHFASSTWGTINLLISLVFLGIGGMLFIFMMSTLFTRYIFYALPPAQLTPTIWIGIAPTSIMTILVLKWIKPLASFFNAGAEIEKLMGFLARPVALGLWGFALFWLIFAILVTTGVHRREQIPFALSWWAFIFPTAAFVIASSALYQAWKIPFIAWTGIAVLVFLLGLWLWNLAQTAKAIQEGRLFPKNK